MQVEDWETGEMVIIQLDPLKAPAETAKDLYKVARKQDRTGSAIFPIIQACAHPVMPLCLLHAVPGAVPCNRLQQTYGWCVTA